MVNMTEGSKLGLINTVASSPPCQSSLDEGLKSLTCRDKKDISHGRMRF